MTNYQFSLKIPITNSEFCERVYNYTINKFPKKYAFKNVHQRYDLRLIISEIIYFLDSVVCYKLYRGPISKSSLNDHILFFAHHKIFENVYQEMHNKYKEQQPMVIFKNKAIDTSFIINKNGKENVGRNAYFKNKNCLKLSYIVDINGIPESVVIVPGNMADSKIGELNINAIDDKIKDINIKLNPYLMGDKGYDTKNFREKCIEANYKPLIDYNKRNTKDKKKIKHLTKREKHKYNKRIIVENSFATTKQKKRLMIMYDSYLSTYRSFVFLSLCTKIQKFIKTKTRKPNKPTTKKLNIG